MCRSKTTTKHEKMGNKTRQNGATAIITTLWHGFLQLWAAEKDDQHCRDSVQKQEKEEHSYYNHTHLVWPTKPIRPRRPTIFYDTHRWMGTKTKQGHPRLAFNSWTAHGKKQIKSKRTRNKQTATTPHKFFRKSKTGRDTPPRYNQEAWEDS